MTSPCRPPARLPGYLSFLAFYEIDKLEERDQIFVEDANGREYTYEVFRTLEVNPTDLSP